jgi:predicted transcriptional regulator
MVSQINSYDDNAEDLYIDYFDTLTPKNRALSNRCVDIIDQFSSGQISQTARERLQEFKKMANDLAQMKFLSGLVLLDKVSNGKGKTHG